MGRRKRRRKNHVRGKNVAGTNFQRKGYEEMKELGLFSPIMVY